MPAPGPGSLRMNAGAKNSYYDEKFSDIHMHEVIHFILLPYNEYISFKLKAISIIKVVDMWVIL